MVHITGEGHYNQAAMAYSRGSGSSSSTQVAEVYFHDSPLSPGPSGGAGTSTFKSGSYVICGNAQKMKVRGGFLGFFNALKKQNLVVEPDPLFKRAAYRWVGKLPPGSVKSSARFWIALRFTSKGVKYLRVLRGTGLVIAILAK